jgi:triphosphoribosyl-dephospho-CoA synthase
MVTSDIHLPLGLLVQIACIWEATARKIGNVHPGVAFEKTSYLDFVLSAAATGHALHFGFAQGVGETVVQATRSTRAVCGSNTNLGIVLLLAPLVASWELSFQYAGPEADELPRTIPTFRDAVRKTLDGLTIDDTRRVYNAIRIANPGGLGSAPEQDVRNEPTVTLLEAMKLAADRDMIARQYANGFADVFDFGVPAFLAGFERFGCVEAAIIDSQLRWLAEYPDSLIARKNGPAVAEDVRRRAEEVLKLGGLATPEGRRAGVALDRYLRSDGNKLNPGTTADLITACLFVALRENKVVPSAPFRWQTDEWL